MSALPDFGQKTSNADRGRYRFGPFILVPGSYTLTRAGVPVAIGARALGLLVHFVTHPGKVIDKAELIRAVWGDRLIEENNLTVQLSSLRRLLGDGVGGAQYIRTLAGRGYVFVAPVTSEAPTGAAESAGVARVPRAAVDPVPLIGRQTELAELTLRLAMSRIVLLTGIGGVGKSRLVREFVYGTGGQAFQGGTFILDLSGVADEATAAAMIAAALDTQRGAAPASPRHGFGPSSLLVLDASETTACFLGRLIHGYLGDNPDLSFLISSRETIPVSGGMSPVRLMPLSVPPDGAEISASEAMTFDSIRLLTAHAAIHHPRFVLTDADAEAACRICRELDGLPLAIEMVAPHLRLLNLNQIAERIGDGVRAAAGGGEDRPLRHRTLRAVYDDSFARLTPAETLQIRELAVFRGGASLAGAVAVSGTADEWLVLDALAGLNDKSLVEVDVAGPTPRYTLLRGIRHFAAEETAPAEAHALRRQHADYVCALFTQGAEEWPRMHSTRWLRLFSPDLGNLHAALTFAFGEDGCVALGRRLLATLYPFLIEGEEAALLAWLDRPEAHPSETTPPELAGRIWLAQALKPTASTTAVCGTENDDGEPARTEMVDRAAASFQAAGETLMVAAAHGLTAPGAPAAIERLNDAETLLAPVPVTKWHIQVQVRRGAVLTSNGDLIAALAAYESALRAIAWIGDPKHLAIVTVERSEILFGLGRAEEALAALETVEGRLPDLWRSTVAPVVLDHLVLSGARPAAMSRLRSILQDSRGADAVSWKPGKAHLFQGALNALSLLAVDTDAVADAARLSGFARAIRGGITARLIRERLDRRLRDRLLSDSLDHYKAEGRAWTAFEADAALTRCLAHVQDDV